MKNSLCIALWSGLFLLVAACEATNSPNASLPAAASTEVTTLEATPSKLVLLLEWGNKAVTVEEFLEYKRLGAEHCEKFNKVGKTQFSLNLGSTSGVLTFSCVSKKFKPETRETRESRTVAEIRLHNKLDREICRSLRYGNLDYAKEAERRELTEKKCKEILGQ